MKIIFLSITVIFLLSCTSKPVTSEKNSIEKDKVQSSENKESFRSKKEREKLPFDKIEETYISLKVKPFYFIHEVLEQAMNESKWDKAEFYAKEYLALAPFHKNDWNYGNAIFDSNVALSQIALSRGDKKNALKYLIAASNTPGSPQLDSFGPFNNENVRKLLQEFARLSEKKTLIEFANNCKKFVEKKSDRILNEEQQKNHELSTSWNLNDINYFKDQIKDNKIPDFKSKN